MDTTINLRAFVGRSFLPEDESPWHEVQKILDSLRPLGFVWEDASEANYKRISDKAREGIENNDVYIGILSKRLPISEPGILQKIRGLFRPPIRWSPPPWVVQESGYALGKGRRVLLLIEQGVDFPASNIDADREWIPFSRGAVNRESNRIVAAVSNMLSERLPRASITHEIAPLSKPELESSEQEQKALDSGEQISFNEITTLIEQRRFLEADRMF